MSEQEIPENPDQNTEEGVPLTQKPSAKLQMLTYISMAFATGAVLYCIWLLLPQSTFSSARNKGSVEWLPAEASDISYARGSKIEACEFTMSEKDFLEWSKAWNPVKLTKREQLARYTFFLALEDNPLLQHNMSEEEKSKHLAATDDGYSCAYRDDKLQLRILYDGKSKRVYLLREKISRKQSK